MIFLPSMLASRRTSINVCQGSGFFHCAYLKTIRRRSLLSLRLLFLLRLILRAVNIQSKVKMQIGLFFDINGYVVGWYSDMNVNLRKSRFSSFGRRLRLVKGVKVNLECR